MRASVSMFKAGCRRKAYLNSWKMLWSFIKVHPAEANSNGPGGDDDDSMAIFMKLDSCLDNRGQN